MIPPKAIKKVKNEVHLEIAAGSLIAYGVFPQTSEGIQKAKETAASKDTWLAPSDLPEYYDTIENDLIIGKETEGIRAIRRHLKEFYGISSAGTEGYIDTRSSRPATPASIEIQWFSITQVGPSVWEKLKAQLTGKGYFSEVNLSEKDADELIANIKKSGEFPSLKDQSGIHNEVYQNWLVDTYLPNYGNTQVYNPGDKFVDDGKEFADKIVDDLDVALEETSNKIEDAIDAILEADKKKYEDFKKQLNRKVNHPELFPELQHIRPRYMWGQNGLYDLEFKSDIDRAIYFAGKLGGNNKDSQDKVAVREWLFLVTGLNVRDDYDEIKKYRGEILALILQLVKLNPNEREIIVPPVYDGYYQDPDEDEEEEEDDEENDDLYGTNLDDLLDSIKDDDGEDPEKVEDQIEEKKQELEDAVEEEDVEDDDEDMGSEDDIPDELLQDDVDPSVLEEIINNRKGKTGTKERKSYYVSNTKLLQGITKSLAAVTGQLEQVNQSLLEQNDLIRANIEISTASLEALQAQDDILTTKFDAILNAFQKQYEQSEKAKEDAERLRAEAALEDKTVAAGTEDPKDLTKGGKKGGINRARFIRNYFARKLGRKLYRKAPKRLRVARTQARKLQKLPGKMGNKLVRGLTNRLPKSAQSAIKGAQAAKGVSGAKLPGINRLPGIRQALAAWEYGERKKAGQSDVQALTGIGAGLAGASAGGALGAKAGALAGAAIGSAFFGVGAAPGAAIGAVLGGVFGIVGGFIGGNMASDAADQLTGANKVGQDDQHERGTNYAEPGTAMLHGTEMLVDKDKADQFNPFNAAGATLVAAASKFINGLGPGGAAIAPMFEQKAAPLVKLFGLPATTAQTNVGGSFSSLGGTFDNIKKKKKKSIIPDEFEGMSREEIEALQGDPESFAEKLLKMIDPEDKFKNFLDNLARKIRNPFTPLEDYDGTGIEGDLKGNIVNPMEQGELQDYPGAMFGAPRSGGRKHMGRDIIGPPGMKFVSSLPGKVTQVFEVADIPGGGISYGITVEHANNIKTRYLHVTPSVKVGDQVKAGQKLGVITKTDNISSAPHLHFEMIVNGRHVDPDKAGSSVLRKAYKMADIQAGKVPGLSLDPDGSTPLETYAGTPAGPTGGQDIKENFGMQTGQERMFTSGGKQYKAHKTATGFEFFDGMTRLNTTKDTNGNVANQSIVNDFVAQQKQALYAPPKAESIQMLNEFETSEQAQYIIINQQKQPQLPQSYGNIQFQNVGGQWRSTKEYDVAVIEKLRLSLQ